MECQILFSGKKKEKYSITLYICKQCRRVHSAYTFMIKKISLNICYLEASEEFRRDSKASSN